MHKVYCSAMLASTQPFLISRKLTRTNHTQPYPLLWKTLIIKSLFDPSIINCLGLPPPMHLRAGILNCTSQHSSSPNASVSPLQTKIVSHMCTSIANWELDSKICTPFLTIHPHFPLPATAQILKWTPSL